MAGPLRQTLKALNVKELRSIKREFCPQVQNYRDKSGKTEFIDSIQRSLQRSMEKDELTYQELMEFIVDDLTEDKSRVTTRIKDTVRDMELSKNAGEESTTSVREKWISSEIFQALKHNLEDTDYTIRQEKYYSRDSIDLLISHVNKKRNYPIEVKPTRNMSSFEKLPTQIRRYKKKIPYIKRFFAIVIIEKEKNLPENKSKVKHILEDVNNISNTTILKKTPDELRYSV